MTIKRRGTDNIKLHRKKDKNILLYLIDKTSCIPRPPAPGN